MSSLGLHHLFNWVNTLISSKHPSRFPQISLVKIWQSYHIKISLRILNPCFLKPRLETQPKSKHKQISPNLSFTSRHQVISSRTVLPFSYVYTSFDIPRNRNKLRSHLVSRIGLDNPLYSGYVDGRNEKLVSNLKLEDGLLFHETWPFPSHPKW